MSASAAPSLLARAGNLFTGLVFSGAGVGAAYGTWNAMESPVPEDEKADLGRILYTGIADGVQHGVLIALAAPVAVPVGLARLALAHVRGEHDPKP